ncbi:hypothetical protein TNCV_5074441 [Trichonephila clavipes]|nr:hypothetical protein TNCV_5074441 [Trichonephila clavipes]
MEVSGPDLFPPTLLDRQDEDNIRKNYFDQLFKKRPDADREKNMSGCELRTSPDDCRCSKKSLFCNHKNLRKVPLLLPQNVQEFLIKYPKQTNILSLGLQGAHEQNSNKGCFTVHAFPLWIWGNEMEELLAKRGTDILQRSIRDLPHHVTKLEINTIYKNCFRDAATNASRNESWRVLIKPNCVLDPPHAAAVDEFIDWTGLPLYSLLSF